MRPRSILLFERVFIATVALGVAATLWTANRLAGMELTQRATVAMPTLAIVSIVLTLAVSVTLLHFIAHRGSDTARWTFVAVYGFGLAMLVATLARGRLPDTPSTAMAVAGIGLRVAMLVLLFRPDAAAWFAAKRRRDG